MQQTQRRGPAKWSAITAREWSGKALPSKAAILSSRGKAGAEPGRFGQCSLTTETITFPAGSIVVPLNQRLSKVAIHWLEPEAPDSAMRWGFFDSIFEQKEYGEAYVMEKVARETGERPGTQSRI